MGGGRAGTSGDGSAPASAPGASPVTKVERLRVDIKDLDIAGVEAVKGRDVVVTGKHLCGSATDLALRCCLANTNGGCDGDKSSAAACRVTGVALATCCHHRSEWRSYVNKPLLRDLGFGRDDFRGSQGCLRGRATAPRRASAVSSARVHPRATWTWTSINNRSKRRTTGRCQRPKSTKLEGNDQDAHRRPAGCSGSTNGAYRDVW